MVHALYGANERRPVMDHIAIDLGGRESQVCVRGSDGVIREERRLATLALPDYLARRAAGRVILETCTESWRVADAARAQGHDVRIVPTTLVRALGVGARRTKNDRRDAQALSAASCRLELPSVHLPSATARSRKLLCGTRAALVAARTQLINTVRGWLRQQGRRPRSGSVETFPPRVRALGGAGLPTAIERQLETIAYLTTQIAAADRELGVLVAADPICARLMTVPGVGPVTAARFTAALDTAARFGDAHAVASYLGLVPGEASSGARVQRLGITKAGAAAVRSSLVQAAWSVRRLAPRDPLVQWARRVEQRRGRTIAIVALARKLAGILFALWRDGTTYDPRRGAR
jgi:transposase